MYMHICVTFFTLLMNDVYPMVLLFLLNLAAVNASKKYHFRLHNIAFNIVFSVYKGKLIKHRLRDVDLTDLLIVLPMQHLIVSCFKSSHQSSTLCSNFI